MRAVLTNFGSTGDVQQFPTLAGDLGRHGRNTTLALTPDWRGRAEQMGLEFIPLGPDAQPASRDVFGMMLASPDPVEEFQRFPNAVTSRLPEMCRDLRAACRNTDVLIGGPHQPAASMVHETTGIPFVSLHLGHFNVPSQYRPPPGSRLRRVPVPGPLAHLVDRVLWARLRRGVRRMSAPAINPHRVRAGLPPLDEPWFLDSPSDGLALFAVSRFIACPPPDWPPRYHLTGFFFPDDGVWPLDPALAEFMDAGEPSVVITFGSMVHQDPGGLTDPLLDAIKRVGSRAVIEQGWSGPGAKRLPVNVRAGVAAYAWLFPRAACVVHHGGVGTTAQTLRAGVPSVFVPHLADQHDWAAIVGGLGGTVAPIPYPRLSAERLASAITATLERPALREITGALGTRIRSEPGVRMARELIDGLLP